MTQHTPGPWIVDYDNADERGGGQWYNVGPARVWFSYSSSKEEEETAKADARLIAAAPRLLEGLKALCDAKTDLEIAWARSVCRDIIAEAEGRNA